MKKAVCALLAGVMILGLAAPALAADTKLDNSKTDANVELHGEVERSVRLISVVVPTTISFNVATDNEGLYKGMTSGVGQIINNSMTSDGASAKIDLKVVGVSDAKVVEEKTGLLDYLNLAMAPGGATSAAPIGGFEKYQLSTSITPDAPVTLFSGLNNDGVGHDFRVFAQSKMDGETPVAIPVGSSYTVNTTLRVSWSEDTPAA